MADVAREAGCSLNTVSRALNGKPDVSARTRAQILEIAQRLGYIPNAPARSLAAGRTQTIGLVITDPAVLGYATLISAVEQTARRAGYVVLLATSHEDPAQEDVALRALREQMVQGILLVPTQVHVDHLNALRNLPTPVVLMLRSLPEFGWDYVGIDNDRSSFEATRHLIRLGHRRIAYIGRSLHTSQARDRLSGFLRALAVHDVERDDRLIRLPALTSVDVAAAYQAVRDLVQQNCHFTALLAYSSHLAFGAMRALRDHGYRIPEDVAVVAQGANDVAPYLDVPLTYVDHPVAEVGVRATELLLRRIATGRPDQPEQVVIAPELVVLESCGARLAPRRIARR